MLVEGQRIYLRKKRGEIRKELSGLKIKLSDSTDFNKSRALYEKKKRSLENKLHKNDYVIKNKAKKALEDLTLIAQTIPERQKAEIFTKDSMRELIKAVLKDSDKKFDELITRQVPYHPEPEIRKRLYAELTERERKSGLPEPIYNKRIFDLGLLLAGFGINSAYDTISWRQRLAFEGEGGRPTKTKMLELMNNLESIMDLYGDEK